MSTPDMQGEREVVALYQAMSALNTEMLAAARAADWELFAVLEARSSRHVQELQGKQAQAAIPGDQSEQVVRIIHKILAENVEIRALGEAAKSELSAMINSVRAESKLANAYHV